MVDSFIETGICVCATEYECHQLALEQNLWELACFREDSMDFELGVRGCFLQCCFLQCVREDV